MPYFNRVVETRVEAWENEKYQGNTSRQFCARISISFRKYRYEKTKQLIYLMIKIKMLKIDCLGDRHYPSCSGWTSSTKWPLFFVFPTFRRDILMEMDK